MSYEKQTWANGDVITAEKLNHIEDGVGGDTFYVKFKSDMGQQTCDKTYEQILAAYNAGKKILCFDGNNSCPVEIYYNSHANPKFFQAYTMKSQSGSVILVTAWQINENDVVTMETTKSVSLS